MVHIRPIVAALVASLFLPAACLAGDFPSVAPADLAAALAVPDGPLLLDVRTDEEFAGGHVPGALQIPIQDLPDRIDELATFKSRGVIAYCESGRRATRALERLREAGFENLRLLDGSMKRWRTENPAAD